MYKYVYEKVSCDFGGFGMFDGKVIETDDYQTIIDTKAKEGYRYVGWVPTKQRGTGHISEIDLVFEKEIESKKK